MQLDMLSPFLPPSHDTGVTALVLPPWPKRWEAKAREVAMALSLWESLLLPVRCLPHLLRIYAMQADPAMQVIELASEDTADGQVDTPIVQLRAAQLERGSDSTYWDAEGTSTDAGECLDSAWVILGRHRFRLTKPWHREALRCQS